MCLRFRTSDSLAPLTATKNVTAAELPKVPALAASARDPRIVLELDFWALFPRR